MIPEKLERARKALGGVSGALAIPFDEAGELCAKRLKPIVDRLAKAGVHNIVSAGCSGEFFSLSYEESLRAQDECVAAIAGRAFATAAIGRSLREAKDAARAAQRAGFNAVAVHQPLDPFLNGSGATAYLLELAEFSELPVIPCISSPVFFANDADIVRLTTHANVAGVIFSRPDLMALGESIRMASGFALWVCGLGERWAPFFYALGAKGFVSRLANVAPQKSMSIWRALEASNDSLAARLVNEITPFEAMRTANGADVAVIKKAMELIGLNVGPTRLPGLPKLLASELKALETILHNWGIEALMTNRVLKKVGRKRRKKQ